MKPYTQFKANILLGWPDVSVWHCAMMVLLDEGEKFNLPMKDTDFNKINEFLEKIKVPPADGNITCSRYLATYYQKTNDLMWSLKGPKIAALPTFLADRKSKPAKTIRQEFKQETRRVRTTRYVELRALDRKHDWKTVK
jgi:hypothetical protein